MHEDILLGLLMIPLAAVIIGVISYGLHYFVALKAAPTSRAAWTAGLAYLSAALILLFNDLSGYEALAPAIAMPGGFLAFWFWRAEFRKIWIDDPELAPAGAAIANDDWRVGLMKLLGLIAAAVAAAIARELF